MARYGRQELMNEVGEATGLGFAGASKLWGAVVRLVEGTTAAGRGLNIPGLGRWTYQTNSTREKGAHDGLDSNILASHKFRAPVFVADPKMLNAHGLATKLVAV